jgi:hypothetical protein
VAPCGAQQGPGREVRPGPDPRRIAIRAKCLSQHSRSFDRHPVRCGPAGASARSCGAAGMGSGFPALGAPGLSVSHNTPDHRLGLLWQRHCGGGFVWCTKSRKNPRRNVAATASRGGDRECCERHLARIAIRRGSGPGRTTSEPMPRRGRSGRGADQKTPEQRPIAP